MLKLTNLSVCAILVIVLRQSRTEDPSLWPSREFRGAWIATVANIDWPSNSDLTTASQKQELDTIVATLEKLHFNAIVFQVRCAGDAMYDSLLEPWSTYLTGSQGQPPDPLYDPLEYLIEKAHAVGIEVHAWFNPYRARAGSTSRSGLAPNHMANRFPNYTYVYGNNVWVDPGSLEVRSFIIDVLLDVAKRYDVDGIHMDDYFYPYPEDGVPFPDSQTYAKYRDRGGFHTLEFWRRENVDLLIQKLEHEIHVIKPYLKFGISPFGIWKPGYPESIRGFSSYDSLYADSRKWLQEGWVDYMAPQLYWRIHPPAQSYPVLLDWWLQQNNQSRHVYTGNYAAAAITKNWGVSEIVDQVKISRTKRLMLSLGNIQFSVKYFVHNDSGMATSFGQIYRSKTLTPEMSWLNITTPPLPQVIHVHNHSITWRADTSGITKYVVVYKLIADVFDIYKMVHVGTNHVDGLPNGSYALRAVNRAGIESQNWVKCVVSDNDGVIVG